MFCEAKLFYSFLRNFWAGREAQIANLIGSSHTRTQFTFFETRMTVGRSIYLRRNIMAFQIVLGRDAKESLFNEKFPNFFDELNDFGIAYLGSSNLADPAKTFATVSISKLHIKLFFRKKCERKLKWICSPQLHLFITFEAKRCHLNTRNKEELVCKCFSDLRLPITSYRVCLIEYVWIPFPGCIIFVRFSALLRTSRLFTAGGGEGGLASLPELKGGEGGSRDYRNITEPKGMIR